MTPDGRRAVSTSDDQTLRLWDLETGEELLTLRHDSALGGVAVTPDGRRAVSTSQDHTLKVWELMPAEQTQVSTAVLSDRPLDCADIAGPDRLGYAPYAAALFQLISHTDTSLPLSMAVSAPWGSGKTSIMQWVRCELDYHREGKEHICTVIPGVEEWNPSANASDRQRWHATLPWRRGSDRAPDSRTDEVRSERENPDLGLTRRCRTVWIDAWKYESSAALWAAFTKEVYL